MNPIYRLVVSGPWGWLVLAVLLAWSAPVSAGSILVEYRANPPQGVPFELHGDIVGHVGAASPTQVEVVEVDELSNPLGTCTVQVNTWIAPGRTHTTGAAFFVPPTARPAPRRFLIRAGDTAIPTDGEPLAQVVGADVIVDNGHFSLRHEAALGGLPESIDFASATSLTLEWEDRLYRSDQGWYWPRSDDQATIGILANGELAAIIEVNARYLERNSGAQHPSDPRLTYQFTYFKNSPLLRLEGSTRLQTDFVWDELHVAHLSHPSVSAEARWAASNVVTAGFDDESTGGLADLSQTMLATRWAAIWGESTVTPAGNVGLAVILAGESQYLEHDVRLYSSADDTYNYLTGQWRRLDTPSADFSLWICWEDEADLLPEMRTIWGDLSMARPGRILASPALSDVATERAALPSFTPEQANGRMLRHQLEELQRSAEQLESYEAWSERLSTWREVNEQMASASTRQTEFELPWAGVGPLGTLVYFVDRDYLLGFDGAGNLALTAIYHDASRTHFMAAGALSGLFTAFFTDSEGDQPGLDYRLDALRAQEADLSFETSDRSLHLVYTGEFQLPAGEVGSTQAEVAQATLVVRGYGDSATLHGSVDLTSGSRLRVSQLVLPLLDGLGGLTSSELDEVVVPRSWGERIADPGRSCGYRQRYPVIRANMQLMSYRKADTGGLMTVFSEDPLGRIKDLECMRDRPGTFGFHLSWTHYPDEGPDQVSSFTLDYPARIHLSQGDWYDAARTYRAWALQQEWTDRGALRGRPDRPEWLDDVTMWFRVHGDGATLQNTLEEMAQTVFESTDDPPGFAVRYYEWHQIPFDNDYPEYFPVKTGVAEAIAQLRQDGIAVMPYTNGQLWDRDTDSWSACNAQDFATRDRSGALVTENWAGQQHSVMCPYTGLWRSTVVDLATCVLGSGTCTFLGTSYPGLDAPALYLDQIGETTPVMCHAPHSSDPASQHPPGGVRTWVEGRRSQLRDIRELEDLLDKDLFLSTEGGAEPYLDLFDGFLMLSSRDVTQKVPLLTAVYNEYIMNFTVGISAAELEGTHSAARSKLAENFLFGSQGSVYEWWIDTSADPVQFQFITRLGQAWRTGLEFLAYGEMLRPPRLTGDFEILEEDWQLSDNHFRQVFSPSVRAAAYRADDGRIGLFVTNVSLSPQPVTIEWEYGERAIEEWLLDGSSLPYGSGEALDLTLDPVDVRLFVLSRDISAPEEEPGIDEAPGDMPPEEIDLDASDGDGLDVEADGVDDFDAAGEPLEDLDIPEDPGSPTDTSSDEAEPSTALTQPADCSCSSGRGDSLGLPFILLLLVSIPRRLRQVSSRPCSPIVGRRTGLRRSARYRCS